MPLHQLKLVPPKGPSKSIFQPNPATVAHAPMPGAKTTSSGHAGKASPPNSGKPA